MRARVRDGEVRDDEKQCTHCLLSCCRVFIRLFFIIFQPTFHILFLCLARSRPLSPPLALPPLQCRSSARALAPSLSLTVPVLDIVRNEHARDHVLTLASSLSSCAREKINVCVCTLPKVCHGASVGQEHARPCGEGVEGGEALAARREAATQGPRCGLWRLRGECERGPSVGARRCKASSRRASGGRPA